MSADCRRSYWPVCERLRACRYMALPIREIILRGFQRLPVIWRDIHLKNWLNTWLRKVFLPGTVIIMPWVLWSVWGLRSMVVRCGWAWRTIIRLMRLIARWGVWNDFKHACRGAIHCTYVNALPIDVCAMNRTPTCT